MDFKPIAIACCILASLTFAQVPSPAEAPEAAVAPEAAEAPDLYEVADSSKDSSGMSATTGASTSLLYSAPIYTEDPNNSSKDRPRGDRPHRRPRN